MDLLITMALIAGARLLARTVIERPRGGVVARGKEVIVVGAGDAGRLVVQEMQRSRMLAATPIGFVDDDRDKRNSRILGVRVLGTTDELPRIIRDHQPDEILIAIPSASGQMRRRVVDAAQKASIPVKTLPGLYELIAGDVNLAGQIRPVQVEDVLGREQVEVDFDEISAYLRNQTVLVTGAGGSIGSELCRQIARVGPARLLLADNAETPLFEIERELVDDRDFTPALPIIVDVKDRKAVRREIFEKYRPTVVFHAAAYKHVPLMNTHPLASVRNNVIATRVVSELAAEFDVERFVLVSTDKAVNPQTVMGQSKAICEWIVESLGHRRDIATRFVAVRFGNVLNSSGSVIPTFRRQIEKGGPVTVTHPEMTRYFMTIPEAVSLVVQAGAIGGRGQVFVLDMGEPVKIVDLACNMIRLSGKEPRLPGDPVTSLRDVAVKFVGSRPGEKLHEELWGDDESVGQTDHSKIMRLSRPAVDADWLARELAELERLADEGDTLEVVAKLNAIVHEPQRESTPTASAAGLPDSAASPQTAAPPTPSA
jgi:FlaA1/EpsC-like NDP-sugar epimerase